MVYKRVIYRCTFCGLEDEREEKLNLQICLSCGSRVDVVENIG